MKTHGLNHLHIAVQDLEKSLRFYAAFGFVEVGSHDTLHFLVRPGSSDVLTLNTSAEPGIDHFGFLLEDPSELDAAIAQLESCGGTLIERTTIGGGIPSAFIADPDGYRVQI
jgi:catechol 2,3-dioxygenase-like lactoylglutathione lyase family enzyme